MFDPAQVPLVSITEIVTRYVVFSKWFLSSDQKVRADAFIPYPHIDLSVTRLRSATYEEIWSVGSEIAVSSGKNLYGRADVNVEVFSDQNLATSSDPIPGNPNHAIVTGWPAEKHLQKMIALEIAAAAKYLKSN